MSPIETKDIIQKMEGLGNGQKLVFKLSPTFGGQTAIIELNPLFGQKGQKKFTLRIGKDEKVAGEGKPFWEADKAKKLAGWVGERHAELIRG